MVNTKVTLCGVELDNPVIPASGTFGYGYEFAELYDINLLGTFSFKGTTREPRFGNPTPYRGVCRGPAERGGTAKSGVDAVISEELPAQAGLPQAGDGECQRLFSSGIRRGLRESWTPRSRWAGWR